jgi:hypothetical protein
MRRRIPMLVAATSAAALAIAPAWGASGRTAQSESFFASGNAAAHWDNSQADSDGDGWSQTYEVQDASSFAGTTLHHVEGRPAPQNSPSYWFKSDAAHNGFASAGAPRLVVEFADGGNIELRPLTWSSSWTEEGADQSKDWDNNGGTCGFEFEQDYQTVRACHGDSLVTAAFIVTDAPYGPYQLWIDQVQYDDTTISQPSDNSNSS